MLGLFPTLQSRIDHFSKSSTGITVRRWFDQSLHFAKCHWPRLVIGYFFLKSIPEILPTIRLMGPLMSQIWLGFRPQTRHEWSLVKVMIASFAFYVVDPLVKSWFVIMARPNPSNLPAQTSLSTTASFTAANLVQDKEPLAHSEATSTSVSASVTSPYVFRVGQGLFVKWCAHALAWAGMDIWFLKSDQPYMHMTRLLLDLVGYDPSIPVPEMGGWVWLEEGWAWVEMLAFGYALWVLLKDLKGVKREGWGLKAEKEKDEEKLERGRIQ